MSSYDTWKCTDPADAADDSLPCKFFSTGECMVCGARDGERCEVEFERINQRSRANESI